jgi:hypothetical protein
MLFRGSREGARDQQSATLPLSPDLLHLKPHPWGAKEGNTLASAVRSLILQPFRNLGCRTDYIDILLKAKAQELR